MKRFRSSDFDEGWGTRRGPLAVGLVGVMAAVSLFFMYRIRQNIVELTSDTMPGTRLANTLIEAATVGEVARLRRTVGRVQEQHVVPDQSFETMKRTMQEYHGAIFTESDRKNWEKARADLQRYETLIATGERNAILDQSFDEMLASYRTLRDYNRERSHSLVSDSGEHIRTAMLWNVFVLCALLVSLASLTIYIALQRVRDVAPDDF